MTPPSTPGTPDPLEDARARELAEFLAPGPLPEAARMNEAEAHLLAELERELGVTIGPPTRVPARAVTDRSPGGLGAFFARLVPAPARPALAVAAAVIVIGGVWTQFRPVNESAPLLRGPAATSPGWKAHAATTVLGDGQTRLTWAQAPGATRYTVVFLAGDLNEIARVDSLTETELVLRSTALPPGLSADANGDDVLWRVTAYAGPDEIARSTTNPVTLP